MPATASIRELRNSFPKVRKIVETEGEVLLTEGGKARYRLTLHTQESRKSPPPIDFWSRLTAYQPTPVTGEQARALSEENRGDR